MGHILKKLVNNSQSSIDDGVYEISIQKEESKFGKNHISKTLQSSDRAKNDCKRFV